MKTKKLMFGITTVKVICVHSNYNLVIQYLNSILNIDYFTHLKYYYTFLCFKYNFYCQMYQAIVYYLINGKKLYTM